MLLLLRTWSAVEFGVGDHCGELREPAGAPAGLRSRDKAIDLACHVRVRTALTDILFQTR